MGIKGVYDEGNNEEIDHSVSERNRPGAMI